MATKEQQPKINRTARNKYAVDPLMRKGGAHITPKCASRRNDSNIVNSAIDEYYDEEFVVDLFTDVDEEVN